MAEFGANDLSAAFVENRGRLLQLVRRRLNPVLLKRFDPEDVLSAAYENATKRLGYFSSREDVPVYFKLRTLLLQTLTDLERRNLGAAARDAYREVEADAGGVDGAEGLVADLAADVTSPVSKVDRCERHDLLRAALASLSDADRRIIVLRHFDGLGNGECAAVFGIDQKAASIRYVRALERLQKKLMEYSCFGKGVLRGRG